MQLDVFSSDPAFTVTELTKSINLLSYQPTKLQRLGWFTQEPIDTTSVNIEMEGDVLTLVPAKPRGAPGEVKGLQRRNLRNFQAIHLPQRTALMADEVQNLRAFGSQTETELAKDRLMKKVKVVRRDLDLTIEYHRMGALKGLILDATGSTILDLYAEFGVSQQTQDMELDVTGTKVLLKVISAKRKSEDSLGGVEAAGYHALCSPGFFDALVTHPAVEETYKYQQGSTLRTDRRGGFEFGEVFWEEYRGAGNVKIADNTALLVPLGVPDMFVTYYAPAPYMETVNTMGLPFYLKQEPMRMNVGIEAECQSNPLNLITRPASIIKLGLNAGALA